MSQPLSNVIIPPTPTPPRTKPLSRCSPDGSAALLRSRSEQPLHHLQTASDVIVAASDSVLTTFKVTDPQTPSETAILAEWVAPSGFKIRSLSISPDASVVALVLADHSSAVLALLRPRSLGRLLRITLPWSEQNDFHLVFFSHAALSLTDDQKLRQKMLPQHLHVPFLEAERITAPHRVVPQPLHSQKENAAPYSLVVALDLLIVYSFSACYTRVHSFSSHQSPNSTAHLCSLPALPTKQYTPVLHDGTFLHTLQNPLIPISDLRIMKLLALCGAPPALLALVQLPSGKVAASVFLEHSVMITPLTVRDSRGILFAFCKAGGYILDATAKEVHRIADVKFDQTIGLRVSALPRKESEQAATVTSNEMCGNQLSCLVHYKDSVIKLLAVHDIIHIETLVCKLPFI